MQASKRFHWPLRATAAAAAVLAAGATAGPLDPRVVAGQATVQVQGSTTRVVQGSDRAIIDWRAFHVKQGELAEFQLPSATSAVLNRVVGADPSVIAGALRSNGQVYLINRNGVLVAPGGQVLSNGFTASTLDIPNDNFLRGGALAFRGDSTAGVVNQGTIAAREGDVVLIASRVENGGTITSPGGTAALAGASAVTLVREGLDRLTVRIDVPAGSGGTVAHTGRIEAAAADLRAVGGNPLALAIRTEGAIRALALRGEGGRIYLGAASGGTEVAGTLDAQSATATGGDIAVTGTHVDLSATARLDASGATGGGRIRVGGGFRGGDADLVNAQATRVAAGVTLKADATAQGNGGAVTVWSDGRTEHAGAISARGAGTGDGGFVETSGKESLVLRGFSDVRSPGGRAGRVVLDPSDITISNAAAGVLGDGSTNFNITDINTQLGLGALEINTNSANAQAGDIKIADIVVLDKSNKLTLRAERDILVNKAISNLSADSGAELALVAGRDITVAPGPGMYVISNASLTFVADAQLAPVGLGGKITIPSGVDVFANKKLSFFAPSPSQLLITGVNFTLYDGGPLPGADIVFSTNYAETSAPTGIYYRMANPNPPPPPPPPAVPEEPRPPTPFTGPFMPVVSGPPAPAPAPSPAATPTPAPSPAPGPAPAPEPPPGPPPAPAPTPATAPATSPSPTPAPASSTVWNVDNYLPSQVIRVITIRPPTTITLFQPPPPAPFGLPPELKDLLDTYFMDAFEMSERASTAKAAAEYWRELAGKLTLADFGNDESRMNVAIRDMLKTAEYYEAIVAEEYEKARQDFWDQMLAPPSAEEVARAAELDRQIDAKLKEIQTAELAARNASVAVNFLTLGLGGWVADLAGEGATKAMIEELTNLSMQRAALDRSTDRALIAMTMTDAVIGLVQRGGPYTSQEQVLIDTVSNMVRNSAVDVAQTASDMFREWKAGKEQERQLIGGKNLLNMYDIGSPAPDFTMRAMAHAGLGPGGDGFNGALVASIAGSTAAAGVRALNSGSLGARISQKIFPFAKRSAGTFTELADAGEDAVQSGTKWISRQPTGRPSSSVTQWMDAQPSKAATNLKPAWKQGSMPNWREVSSLRNVKNPTSAGGMVDDLVKAGAGAADDVAKAAGVRIGTRVANALRNSKIVATIGKSAVGSVFKSIGKVAGPIGTAIAQVVDVGMAAGEIADTYDNGQAKLDKAVQTARTTPITTQTLSDMTATEDGRLQLVAILTGQLKRNPNPNGGLSAGLPFLTLSSTQ